MTVEELRGIVKDPSRKPDEVVHIVGDTYAAALNSGPETFWADSNVSQKFYSLLALIHHAGSNGLQVLEDYNQGFWVGVIVYARQVLEELDVPAHLAEFRRFEAFLAGLLVAPNATQFPTSDSEMRSLQKRLDSEGRDWPDSVWNFLSNAGELFVRPRNAIIESKAFEWINAHADELAPMIDHDEVMKHPLMLRPEL